MEASHKLVPVFDEANLVGSAGLVPVMGLARAAGLGRLLEQSLTVPAPRAAGKAAAVVAGMMTGADSIDDLGMLRHGGMGRLFDRVPAPSTLGTFLRAFTLGNIAQLRAVNRALLPALQQRCAGLVETSQEGLVFIDVDDTIREVHGYRKQAARFGHTRQRGLNIQLATISTAKSAPVIADARLRCGNVVGAQGGARLVAGAAGVASRLGQGQTMLRADSGYYRHDVVAAALRAGALFSITGRATGPTHKAIATISDDAWTKITYPRAVWDETQRCWISEAEVAEAPFVAFRHLAKAKHIGCRLVVRRVKRLGRYRGQDPLFDHWRYHVFITNSDLDTVTADRTHRDHAVIEQVIAELKAGPLKHLPSGKYTANAAWVGLAVVGFNLARAAAVVAGMATTRWETLRRKLINIPARIASRARRLVLHLPQHWPWQQHWLQLHHHTGPPRPAPI